jgi:tetratricopeptide (TPR) repeat protein
MLRRQVAGEHEQQRTEVCRKVTKLCSGSFALAEGKKAEKRGDLGEARRAYQFAAESDDDAARTRAEYEIGCLDNAKGDLSAAVLRFRKSATTTESNLRAIALLYLGIALRTLHDIDGARKAYQECVDCGDTYARGMAGFRLGSVLADLGRAAEAREAYEFTVGLDAAGSAEAAVNLGVMAEADGRWDQAKSLWEYAFAATEENEKVKATAAFNLGRVWEHEGQLRKAKDFYQIAADMPDPAIAERARAYHRTVSRKWRAGR